MPRAREFDRNDVLDKALDLFWSNGYEASSISKLLEVMSLNRGSLYATFQDKHGLFQAVMAHYVEGLSGLITETLVDIEDPHCAVQTFFYRAFLIPTPRGDTYSDTAVPADTNANVANGCLLFNAICELSNTMPEVAEEAGNYLMSVRDLFIRRLIQAEELGLLRQPNDVGASADTLFGMLAGCRTLCKMGFDSSSIKGVINVTLNGLFQNIDS